MTLMEYCLGSGDHTLLRQWNSEKNGGLTPEDVSRGGRQQVWWICDKGHEWQSRVASRSVGGSGCPYCAGKRVLPGFNDLEHNMPLLAAQWHPEKNAPLTARDVTICSNRRVWWLCERGHEWQSAVSHRSVEKAGCPYCTGRRVLAGFNDLGTTQPRLAEQWAHDLNGGLAPEQVSAGSNKRVWWRCQAGHVWRAAVYSRTTGHRSGCPYCAGMVSGRRALKYERILEKTKERSK